MDAAHLFFDLLIGVLGRREGGKLSKGAGLDTSSMSVDMFLLPVSRYVITACQ